MLPGPSEAEIVGTLEKHPSTIVMSPGSDTLKDVDLIWGETEDGPNREWSKMDEEFTNVRTAFHTSYLMLQIQT